MRIGIMMAALAAIYALASLGERAGITLGPLVLIGQHSLFVYWIHVELVYGYASRWWRHRLPLWGTLVAYAAFSALMYGAVRLKRSRTWRLPFSEKRAPGYRVA
jgi:hypothetical protein